MKRIFIVAGEASGDLHAAHLIRETQQREPLILFEGMGSSKMQSAGAKIHIDSSDLAVVGIIEVLTHIRKILGALKKIKQMLKTDPPDLLILVDYPDFNLRLAKFAKKHGIKILYYISPQLWAWRKKRIKLIQKYIDKMAVILPFEVDFYRKNQVEAVYVGNPLVGKVHPSAAVDETLKQFDLDKNAPIIGLLPGSRKSELKYIFPTILKTAGLLKTHFPKAQFIIPLASSFSSSDLEPYLQGNELEIKIIPNQLYNLLQVFDAAIVVSGTVTLEVALMTTPFVIIYKLSPLTALLGLVLVDFDTIGLCNIMAGKKVVTELIQNKASPKSIAEEVIKLIENESYRKKIKHEFEQLKEEMKDDHAISIGDVVIDCLNTPASHLPKS